jgi:ABC-type glutathione transport system ATPase component
MSALLDIGALAKRFDVGGKRLLFAVDEVSFTIGRGETVGLVGESGCGKSTLVRLINRLLDPTSGSIGLGGTDLAAFKASAFAANPNRARIQMVFQDAGDSLNPRYTAADAIADPVRRLKKMSGADLKRRVEALADMTGLPRELLSRFPHQLSGGQKARVGIARALAVEPQLLILDEPTSALDVETEALVMAAIERLMEGRTTFIIAHRLSTVRRCDLIVVLRDGRIAEQGTLSELLRRGGVFAEYYRTQFAPELEAERRQSIPA